VERSSSCIQVLCNKYYIMILKRACFGSKLLLLRLFTFCNHVIKSIIVSVLVGHRVESLHVRDCAYEN
jgi:hypothetical protein